MNENYAAPAITELGSLEELTQGTTSGRNTDQAIPANTPAANIPGFVATHLS